MSSAESQPIDKRVLMGASRPQLVKLAQTMVALKLQAGQIGPQTPDELHALIKRKWGYHIPRVAIDVEYGHCAPFDFICDVFFEKIEVDGYPVSGALVVANREGAKTMGVGMIHALKARFQPGYWGISAGAVTEQSNRAYEVLVELNDKWGGGETSKLEDESDIEESLKSITKWKNGSKVNVLPGTKASLNGPHSNLLHRDEVELFRRDAFDEGDNITKSGMDKNGRPIHAIDVLTSSRKFAKGLLQELLDDHEEARRNNTIPRYKVYKWGIAETIAKVPNCRYIMPAGTPEDQLCACRKIVKGKMPDGTPRSLEKICNGRFARSDGWRPLNPDIIGKFLSNSPAMWEAQQECRKPAAEGLILANFSKETHGIRGWNPNPEYGKIYLGIDAGGTNAHSAHWYQYTDVNVSCSDYEGRWKIVPKNSYVVFDEVYVAEVGNNDFAKSIKAVEIDWKRKIAFFEVSERYMDIAAKAARIDFRKTHQLPTTWRVTREIEAHIEKIVEVVDEDRIFVDVDRCPMWIAEAEAWQRDPSTGKQIDTFNHAMSDARYAIANIDRKLIMEGRHPSMMIDLSNLNALPLASEQSPINPINPKNSPLSETPDTGPAFSDYMRGSPHPERELGLAIHQGAMPAFSDRMW